MKKRDLLTLSDLSEAQLIGLLRKSARLKRHRLSSRTALRGQTVALVFQKPSMRTRVAFEVATLELGGSVIYLGQEDIRLGEREPIKDVARVLSRYVSGIVVRTFSHTDAEEFARYARCPVINGLSDLHHPCQALADFLTLQEHFRRLKGLTVAYVGDGNNVLHSLAQGAVRLGVRLRVATPKRYAPEARLWREAARSAKGRLSLFLDDPKEAVRAADAVYTDVWTSMGQERERSARRKAFRAFQINERLLRSARPGCKLMHCLPAHRGEEITETVMESPRSLIFEQAENRLHAQKALLLMLLSRRKHG